jgi:hypothetical protein
LTFIVAILACCFNERAILKSYDSEVLNSVNLSHGLDPLWHCFYGFYRQSQKHITMADNNRKQSEQDNKEDNSRQSSVGNQQQTTQTGAQNAGGQNIDEQEDQYTDDLQRSGDRSSSNRKTSS